MLSHLAAIAAQLVLLALYVVIDICLELLLLALDAGGKAAQLLRAHVWDLGQTRVGAQKHLLRWYWVRSAGE